VNIFESIAAARIIFIFGIINFVTGMLVLLSCRCIAGARITGNLMKYKIYQRFYKYHCYIWWVFWTSVIVHAVFAVAFLGIPF